MKALKLNLDLSKKVYEEIENKVELRSCYNNTFYAISYILENSDTFKEIRDYKISYGFIKKNISGFDMLFRHGYLTINDNEVIDVTACLWYDVEEKYDECEYYTFKEYDLDSYLDTLMEFDGLPALYGDTINEELRLYSKFVKAGMQYNPIDHMDFIQRLNKNDIFRGIEEFENKTSIIHKYTEENAL